MALLRILALTLALLIGAALANNEEDCANDAAGSVGKCVEEPVARKARALLQKKGDMKSMKTTDTKTMMSHEECTVAKPKYAYKGGKGKTCKKMCDEKDNCYGYSVSKYNNCILWLSPDLIAGGHFWGGARCLVKGAKAGSYTDLGSGKCQACEATPDPTPSPTPEPTPEPVPEEPEVCKAKFCGKNTQPWEKKCTWSYCSGCEVCAVVCKSWCTEHSDLWSKKCSFDECAACATCDEDNDEPAETEVASVEAEPAPAEPAPGACSSGENCYVLDLYNTKQLPVRNGECCNADDFPEGSQLCLNGKTFTVESSFNSVSSGTSGATVNVGDNIPSKSFAKNGDAVTPGPCSL